MDQLVSVRPSPRCRLGRIAHLEIPWRQQLWEREGESTRLCGIKVYYDFNWIEEIGYRRCMFTNGQELARYVKRNHPKGKNPALLLTTSEDVKIQKLTTETEYVVIVNIRLVRAAASAHEFLTAYNPIPISEIGKEIDLRSVVEYINANDGRRREFAQIWNVDGQSISSREAIEVLERVEQLDEQEAHAITQLLIRCTSNANALDSLLDTRLDARDIARWVSGNYTRRKELLTALGNLSADELSALCDGVGDDGDNKSGLVQLMRQHLPLVRRLAANECMESDLIATGYRRKQLSIFKQLLDDDAFFRHTKEERGKTRDEDLWQQFFEENKWIFGYGLNYVFMTSLDGKKLEQVTTGYDYEQSGKRADALMKTVGDISNLCFVEIKTHLTELLHSANGDRPAYRSACWRMSPELAGGIAQSQQTVAKHLMTEQRKQQITDAQDNPTKEEVFFHKPKAFLVIGRLQQFRNEVGVNMAKLSSFEHLRGSISTPEIITFDELYGRASGILEENVSATEDGKLAPNTDSHGPEPITVKQCRVGEFDPHSGCGSYPLAPVFGGEG